MSDPTPGDGGGADDQGEFRWWFEDEIDEELEAQFFEKGGVADVPSRAEPEAEPEPEVDEPPSDEPSPVEEQEEEEVFPQDDAGDTDAGDVAASVDDDAPEPVAAAPEPVDELDNDAEAMAAPEIEVDDSDSVVGAEQFDESDDVDTEDFDEAEDDDDARSPEPAARRKAGRRALRAKRRRRRLARVAVLLLVVGAVAAAVTTIPWERLTRREAPQAAPTADSTAAAAPDQDTLLLIRHGANDNGPALGLTLLASGPAGNAVIFLPVGTIVDIPGFGQDQLGLAYQYGGAALVEASVENLLGVDIDHTAAVSNSGLAALLARTGGLDIEVGERLVERTEAGAAQVRFEPGMQFLDGARLLEFWGFAQRGESELDTFPRQQQVWMSLLAAAEDPQVVEALTSDGAPQLETSANEQALADLLTGLGTAQAEDELGYTLLPVTPFGTTDDTGISTYRPTSDGVEQLVAGTLEGSVPSAGATQGIRVQVLNGVGTPGIGQDVDRRLEGAGFRILLTDNARSFDFNKTRILIYAEDERSLLAAEEVQERLGVGTIQISRQPQSVVDLTIVVGEDFLDKGSGPDPVPTPEEQSS